MILLLVSKTKLDGVVNCVTLQFRVHMIIFLRLSWGLWSGSVGGVGWSSFTKTSVNMIVHACKTFHLRGLAHYFDTSNVFLIKYMSTLESITKLHADHFNALDKNNLQICFINKTCYHVTLLWLCYASHVVGIKLLKLGLFPRLILF